MTARRHKWGDRVPFQHKSERTCLNGCGITRVSRHETDGPRDVHWVEFWRDGERIACDATPACEPVEVVAS
jgi:hypothetical protein